MFTRPKSLTLATLVLVVIPLLSDSVRVGFPQADAQTPIENTKTQVDQLEQLGVQQYRTGMYPQALQTYERVLQLRRQQNDKRGIAQDLNNIGEVYLILELEDKALEVLQPALTMRRELKDRVGEGETLDNIGWAYHLKDEKDQALQTLQQALAIRWEVKDLAGVGKTKSRIGSVYFFHFNQPTKALEILKQALAIHEQVKDRLQTGRTLRVIGNVYKTLQNYPRALEFFEKAIAVNREVKNRAQEGITIANIGASYQQQNKFAQARQFYQKGLPLVRESGLHSYESSILRLISGTYFLENKIDAALEYGQQALEVATKNQLHGKELESLNWLASLYLNKANSYRLQGLYSQAKPEVYRVIELSQSALTLARKLQNRKSEVEALNYLGYAYFILNEFKKASDILEQAVRIAREINDLNQESTALSSLVQIYTNKDKEIEIRLRQVEIARKQKDKFEEASSLISLISSYTSSGKYQKAIQTSQQALTLVSQIEIAKLPAPLQKFAVEFEFNIYQQLSLSYEGLGEFNKAIDFEQQALKKAQSLNQPNLEAQALLHLSRLYTSTFHDYPKAIEFARRGLIIAQKIKQPALEAKALQHLSATYNKQKNYALALEFVEKLLVIAKQLENPQLERDALNSLADIYYNQGNYQKALEFAQQNLALVQRQIPAFETNALTELSQIYLAVGDSTQAVETAKLALTIAQQRQSPSYEALALDFLADAYISRGEYELGIETAQKSLEISRKIKEFYGEVASTARLSIIYDAIGDYNKVIAVAEPNLTSARKIKDRENEAQLILNLGRAYRVIGDYPKAKELIDQGFKIARELKNPRLESIALNSLGFYYISLNDYQKALSLAQQSLKIAQDLKSPPLTISPQFALGDIYSDLGDYKKSRQFYQQALTTAQQLKNRNSEGIALFAQASTYFAEGEPQKTVELSKQALSIFQEIKVPQLQAFTHRMLSVGYGELGNDAQAMEEAQGFLTFAQKTQNSLWEKSALSLIGGLHQKFGRFEQAIVTYQQVLAITTDNQIPGADAYILAGLARIYQNLNQPNIAIKYYKDSVNKIEEIRHGIQGLPPELQKSFLDTTVDFNKVKVSDIYRQLAELLLSQKRDKEALYVQELLRGQEIRDFTITGKGMINKPQIPLTPTETKVPGLSQPLIALGNQVRECEGKNTPQCLELQDKQGKLIDQYTQQLKAHDKEIRENRQTDDTFFDPKNLGKIREIVEAQPDTVMIYPLVRDNELSIQLYAQGGVVKTISVPVGRKELGNAVYEFRQLMEHCENPGTHCGNAEIPQVQAVSRKLYNWLIKPIEPELSGSSVKNLVFALDRVIRYLPMSALYDGKQYLIEKYTVYIAPSADLTDTKDKLPAQKENTQILAMGLSEAKSGFGALPNVPKELDAIVRKNTTDKQAIYPGDKYLNDNFNFRTLRDNLKGHKILHLATHGVFDLKSANKSYILLGTGEQLIPDSIYKLTGLSDIHLVVLSACQTALASPDQQDGVEINSFASNFLNNKAKSVLASLWVVDDPSTAQLMESFYRNLANSKTPITKAQALRLAQLSLLYGKQVTFEDIKRGAINVEQIVGKPTRQTSTGANISHPYYWAPFILMGNGI